MFASAIIQPQNVDFFYQIFDLRAYFILNKC